MAAVHQRSSNNVESSAETAGGKNASFIESMEAEVRRCAEHLERRQSWKAYRSTLDRKANGFPTVGPPPSSVTTAGFQGSSSDIGSRNVGYRSTLPRSFRSSAADQEERALLSPRVIPPGRKSPHKSPDKSSGNRHFRFSKGLEEVYSGHYLEEVHSPGAGGGGSSYPRGNSAPPDAFPCFSAGSGASSRDNSLTPLQSPLGRTPIGAVASHSHSRKSSRSSSSPPPVPPKPGKNRSRRAKSHTPPSPPHRSHQAPHKIEASSYRNKDPLKLDIPVDPIPPTELAAVTSSDKNLKELEFPSAEVDLHNFHEKVMKAKSALSVCTTGLHERVVESSVDKEDYGRQRSAPPIITSPTPVHVLSTPGSLPSLVNSASAASSSGVLLSGVTSSSLEAMSLFSPEMKQVPRYSIKVKSEKQESVPLKCTTATLGVKEILESSVDVSVEEKQDVQINQDEVDTKTSVVETTSIKVSDSDKLLVSVDKEVHKGSVEDQPSSQNGNSTLVVDEVTTGEDERMKGEEEEEKEQDKSESSQNKGIDILEDNEGAMVEEETQPVADLKLEGDKLMKRLEENTEFLSPSTSVSSESGVDKEGTISDASASSPVQERHVDTAAPSSTLSRSPSPSPTPCHIKQEGPKEVESTKSRRTSFEIEEVFLPITMGLQSEDGQTDASEPEVKSIPVQSRSIKQGSKHSRGLSGTPNITQPETRGASEPPETTLPVNIEDNGSRPRLQSEPPMSGTKCQPLIVDSAKLEGASQAVKAMMEELQRQMKERENELVRLHRQKERDSKEKDERIKKLSRENKKVERDKWELLKRARDGAERSLHLRTQLDMKEGALHSLQGELERTRDELVSVKSANTSLRALISDLRASRACTDVAVQVDLIGGSLRRNRSMELAYTHGGLSQEQENLFERSINYRMSTNSLDWPGQWGEREGYMDTTSLTDEVRDITPTPGRVMVVNSQPLGTRESRKSRKRGAFLSKVIKGNGSRRGSKCSVGSMGEYMCVCVCVRSGV